MTKFKIGDKVMYEDKVCTVKVSQKNHATGVIRYQLEEQGSTLINEELLERVPKMEDTKAKKEFAKNLIKNEEEKETEQIFEDLPETEDMDNEEKESKSLKRTKKN